MIARRVTTGQCTGWASAAGFTGRGDQLSAATSGGRRCDLVDHSNKPQKPAAAAALTASSSIGATSGLQGSGSAEPELARRADGVATEGPPERRHLRHHEHAAGAPTKRCFEGGRRTHPLEHRVPREHADDPEGGVHRHRVTALPDEPGGRRADHVDGDRDHHERHGDDERGCGQPDVAAEDHTDHHHEREHAEQHVDQGGHRCVDPARAHRSSARSGRAAGGTWC